jgi:hypothetical protein
LKKRNFFLKKIEQELQNGRYFCADGFAIGTGCSATANGQSVPTSNESVPRMYCADGVRQHRVVPTAWRPSAA